MAEPGVFTVTHQTDHFTQTLPVANCVTEERYYTSNMLSLPAYKVLRPSLRKSIILAETTKRAKVDSPSSQSPSVGLRSPSLVETARLNAGYHPRIQDPKETISKKKPVLVFGHAKHWSGCDQYVAHTTFWVSHKVHLTCPRRHVSTCFPFISCYRLWGVIRLREYRPATTTNKNDAQECNIHFNALPSTTA